MFCLNSITDSTDNHNFPIHDPVVLYLFDMEIGIINTSPGPKFVDAKEARTAQSHEIPCQLSPRHTHTYELWIKPYPGVPYVKHPAGRSQAIP